MAIEAYAERNCSIAKPLAFLGERWTVLILGDLFLGLRRFDEFRSSLGLAANVLSARLATSHNVHRRPGPGADEEQRRANGRRAPEWLAR